MRQTEHLKLQMPEDSDFILIGDLNANAEILDKTLKNMANTLALLNTEGIDLADLLKKKADLDPSGKVKEDQLPEMKLTNFVQVYEARGNFPGVGERNVLYLSKATNKVYFYDTADRQYKIISASLDLGETSSTAYRGDRGKIAYDHSQSPHLQLGETSSTAFRGDQGKIAYDHSRSAHLGLGETSGTAYRGDRGKIAYDHSQSPHAPADALSRAESYTRTEVEGEIGASSNKIREEIKKNDEIKTFRHTFPGELSDAGRIEAYKRNGIVTVKVYNAYEHFIPFKLPAGFRPVSDITVCAGVSSSYAISSGTSSSSGVDLYINEDGSVTITDDARVLTSCSFVSKD